MSQLPNMSKLCVYCRRYSFVNNLQLYGHLSQCKVLRQLRYEQLQLHCYRPIASEVDVSGDEQINVDEGLYEEEEFVDNSHRHPCYSK